MQRPPTCFDSSRGHIQGGNKKARTLKDDRIIEVAESNHDIYIRTIKIIL